MRRLKTLHGETTNIDQTRINNPSQQNLKTKTQSQLQLQSDPAGNVINLSTKTFDKDVSKL